MPWYVDANRNFSPEDRYGAYFEAHMEARLTELSDLYKKEGIAGSRDKMTATLEAFKQKDKALSERIDALRKDKIEGYLKTCSNLDDYQQAKRAEFDQRMLAAATKQLKKDEAHAWLADEVKWNNEKFGQLRETYEKGRTDEADTIGKAVFRRPDVQPEKKAEEGNAWLAARRERHRTTGDARTVDEIAAANQLEAASKVSETGKSEGGRGSEIQASNAPDTQTPDTQTPDAQTPDAQASKPAEPAKRVRTPRYTDPDDRAAVKAWIAEGKEQETAREAKPKIDPAEAFRQKAATRFDEELAGLRDTNPVFAARVEEALAKRAEAQTQPKRGIADLPPSDRTEPDDRTSENDYHLPDPQEESDATADYRHAEVEQWKWEKEENERLQRERATSKPDATHSDLTSRHLKAAEKNQAPTQAKTETVAETTATKPNDATKADLLDRAKKAVEGVKAKPPIDDQRKKRMLH